MEQIVEFCSCCFFFHIYIIAAAAAAGLEIHINREFCFSLADSEDIHDYKGDETFAADYFSKRIYNF